MSNILKKMLIFARRNEVLPFHISLPILVPTCYVTGHGEAVDIALSENDGQIQ